MYCALSSTLFDMADRWGECAHVRETVKRSEVAAAAGQGRGCLLAANQHSATAAVRNSSFPFFPQPLLNNCVAFCWLRAC